MDYSFQELLERSGAMPPRSARGKWLCPECHKWALSVSLERELFHCFEAGCAFSGGARTLRRKLGIRDGRTYGQRQYERLVRYKAECAAASLTQAVGRCENHLLSRCRQLGRRELRAHEAGPGHPETWNILAAVYAEQPAVIEEIERLAAADAAEAFEIVRGASQ